jgi:hypothetical protein
MSWSVSASYFGAPPLTISQEPLSSRTHAGDTTGRVVWECGNVMLRWLQHGGLSRLLEPVRLTAPASTPASVAGLRVLDLSAGAGLAAVAFARGGARTAAAETAEQMPHLARNVAQNAVDVALLEHRWGSADARAELSPPWASDVSPLLPFDIGFCADVLYIALCNRLGDALAESLRTAAALCAGGLVFGFEERLVDEESAWVDALARAGGMSVEEVTVPAGTREDALENAGGPNSGESAALGALFYTAPPVRLFVLRRT